MPKNPLVTIRKKIFPEFYKDFFKDSYVKIDTKDRTCVRYEIRNNNPTFLTAINPIGFSGISYLHELGHFILANEKQILKDDFGFSQFGDPIPEGKWYDLNCEVQVMGIEYMLSDHYGVNLRMYDDPVEFLTILQGYKNYQKFHNLNDKKMYNKVEKAFQHWKQTYHWNYVKGVWVNKNKFLKEYYCAS